MFLLPLTQIPRISSPFGVRTHPLSDQEKAHHGIDLAVPEGSPVLAARAGKVTTVWTDGVGSGKETGNGFVLDHGGGWQTWYMHLSRKDARAGQTVASGQVIGAVGHTGGATGPHLHFELHQNGVAIDPKPYLLWSVGTAVAKAGVATGFKFWLWGGLALAAAIAVHRVRSRAAP